MTQLLESAFAAAARLPEVEQDALARAILADMASESAVDDAIAATPDALARLAAEARGEYSRAKTHPLSSDLM